MEITINILLIAILCAISVFIGFLVGYKLGDIENRDYY